MTIKQELIKYAKDCLSGKIVSCKKHKWACQRFLNDLQKSKTKEWPYKWDEQRAQSIVDFMSYLKYSKGIVAGQFIKLTTSQKFFLCQIEGWVEKKTGHRRFTKSYKEVGRKNAKTQENAGLVLHDISVGSTRNHELYEAYCAGTKRDQSRLAFEECVNLLKGSPLAVKFDINRQEIKHKKTGSFFKALSKDDGKTGDGTNPADLILDEYHQHKTTEFYDLSAGSNTTEPLMSIITTAGKDLNVPCYTQEYKYCSDILNPDSDVENDNYYVDIFEADKGDDPGNPETWKKANPIRAYYPEGVKQIREAYEIAKTIPEKMSSFLTKYLDVWVQARENGYMDMSKWKLCEVKELPISIENQPVYVGFDMSAKIDLTSVAFVIPFQSDELDSLGNKIPQYVVISHSFIPNRKKLAERIEKDKFPYDAYERGGFISLTNSEIVDQSEVMRYVINFCTQHKLKIQSLCFDPANAGKIMMDFSNLGYDVEEVFQSHRSLNESTSGFREQVYEGNIFYQYNPVLNFAMGNAIIKVHDGLIKIDKDATIRRIDPVDAVLCAFKLATYHEFDNIEEAVISWLDS